jgi:hypothetical protein
MADGYDIHLDDKYGQLALIDVAAEAARHEPWFNQTLTSVNDGVVRLGVLEASSTGTRTPPRTSSSSSSRASS